MKNLFFFSSLLILLSTCTEHHGNSKNINHTANHSSSEQLELKEIQTQLYENQKELARIHQEDVPLVHLVYLDIKEGIPLKSLYETLSQLATIDEVNYFHIGRFTNLNDPRAMSNYEIVLSMYFQNKTDYHIYQKHPTHLHIKKALKTVLASPPLSYDYQTATYAQ